ILLASFGSGAGSDAYIIRVLDGIEEKRDRAPKLKDFIERKIYIDYASYARFRGKLRLR
ncbi:MAG: hydroxymethylglutaryl-CoA synthase, partial [Thaumarchaeota archaeon]